MTTTEQPTALAVRDTLTDQQIQQRIRLHQSPGFGLERATAPQLNNLFLYCQKHQMLPGDDVTLYDGRPFLQIAGVVKAMRRHPEYRGYACRPLTAPDKEAWGYDTGDIVIECVIRTDRWGEISARGKVTKDEANGVQRQGQRMNPVARLHPVEMAEKRAIARAQRAAFGLDAVVDEDEYEDAAHTVIEQRNDPVRNAALAARHDEIFKAEYEAQDRGFKPAPPPPPPDDEPEAQWEPETHVDEAAVTVDALTANKSLLETAHASGKKGLGKYTADPSWALDRVQAANRELDAMLAPEPAQAELEQARAL